MGKVVYHYPYEVVKSKLKGDHYLKSSITNWPDGDLVCCSCNKDWLKCGCPSTEIEFVANLKASLDNHPSNIRHKKREGVYKKEKGLAPSISAYRVWELEKYGDCI